MSVAAVVGPAFQGSNCGGNSAALADVRHYYLFASEAAAGDADRQFRVTSASLRAAQGARPPREPQLGARPVSRFDPADPRWLCRAAQDHHRLRSAVHQRPASRTFPCSSDTRGGLFRRQRRFDLGRGVCGTRPIVDDRTRRTAGRVAAVSPPRRPVVRGWFDKTARSLGAGVREYVAGVGSRDQLWAPSEAVTCATACASVAAPAHSICRTASNTATATALARLRLRASGRIGIRSARSGRSPSQ